LNLTELHQKRKTKAASETKPKQTTLKSYSYSFSRCGTFLHVLLDVPRHYQGLLVQH